MTRLLRSGQVLWQLAFGLDYPSGSPVIPPVVPPAVDQTGNVSYYRRYLMDVIPIVPTPISVAVHEQIQSEDIDYLRRYLCDI